ncbi:hypothetical protein GCM10011391_24080 [Pullulanibacillus camelliae]|uniref:YtxH domain-containing protein n=1 Tax=Pullulanibacillus camelliae TaxID=1707096 RepID=A0A8J3DVC0_9BACL|nr:YtxH domain-containing protein [Pullulanibacillus camelliae]GGE44459.1 hypothetical protein GCM10011391_24080 [Pullulanibacillus camelliae]
MSKMKSYIVGFAVGSVVAGATVLLNAPKSGKDLRRDLKETINDANTSLGDVKSAALSLKNNVSDIVSKSLPTVKNTMIEVKSLVDAWQQDIQPNINKISKDIKKIEIK